MTQKLSCKLIRNHVVIFLLFIFCCSKIPAELLSYFFFFSRFMSVFLWIIWYEAWRVKYMTVRCATAEPRALSRIGWFWVNPPSSEFNTQKMPFKIRNHCQSLQVCLLSTQWAPNNPVCFMEQNCPPYIALLLKVNLNEIKLRWSL